MKKIIIAIAVLFSVSLTSCTDSVSTESVAELQEQEQATLTVSEPEELNGGILYCPGLWYAIVRDHADIFEAAGYKVERRNGLFRYL